MKSFYVIVGIVAIVGIAAVTVLMRGSSGANQPVELGEIADAELLELGRGVVYGQESAPITIMEFGDYQCPACQIFAQTVKTQVDLAYIQTGQAKLVFQDFPLPGHPHAFLAARAARCGGEQDRYFDYHDALFRTQAQWHAMQSAAGHFKDLAEEVGLDTDAFADCLDSDRYADVVTANLTLGQRLGVSGTPTILIHQEGGGPAQRLGGYQFIDIQQAIDGLLATSAETESGNPN